METYEFEGKTTEEAIGNASRQLNLPQEELSIDIIEPGSAGIFGLVGGKKAKIRVTVKGPAEEGSADEIAQGDGLALARQTLEDILALIPVEATVTADQTEGKISLNIEGDRSGILIGRKGKTLDAIQFIVNKIVNKALDRKINLFIDSENYRKRREDSLIQMAEKMGNKAKKTGKPLVTAPLNPHDRRIIHLALKEDGDLDTRSRGEGLMKKVVIIPKTK